MPAIMRVQTLAGAFFAVRVALALPTISHNSATPSTSVSTAIPSSTAALSTPIAGYSPIPQSLCRSEIYCPGRVLQAVQLAQIFPDQKTFVDKPTRYATEKVLASFDNLTTSTNYTIASLESWIEDNFLGEGLELLPTSISDFKEDPSFLSGVGDPYVRGWLKTVHGYWRDLARENSKNDTCKGCESSLIPLNHSFVVPGGRFRENYYWDTYWILEGLLVSEVYSLAKSTILNFLDEIETIGFIPNAARVYYLNRSQPPLFTQMLWLYVTWTNDTSFLPRALPLVEKELQWWQTNRTSTIRSPFSGRVHEVAFYNVTNSAPRPEGYSEDYGVAVGGSGEEPTNFNASFRAFLYANLASGAESGMDYMATRWFKEPLIEPASTAPGLRTLNVINQLPVDLNSILYRNFHLVGEMYKLEGATHDLKKSKAWGAKAEKRREAILDLHWDESRLGFYDFNLTSQDHARYWTVASYYPYWSGIYPSSLLKDEGTAQKALAGAAYLTARYNGSIPTSLLETSQQWDFQAWPPHVYIALKAFQNLPDPVSQGDFTSFIGKASNFSYLPPNHFGLLEDDLPLQTRLDGGADIAGVLPWGAAGNVGEGYLNATGIGGEKVTWRDGMVTAIANRYIASAFCSWYATGGSIPDVLGQLGTEALNKTGSVGDSGHMFEKFSALDLDAAGQGGEYTVQEGFGWTNGVALSFGHAFGGRLQTPSCPDFAFAAANSSTSGALPMKHLKTRGKSGRQPRSFW